MKAVNTLLLLLGSNVFMTLAWYGHLKFKEIGWAKDWGLFSAILIFGALPSSNIAYRQPQLESDSKNTKVLLA